MTNLKVLKHTVYVKCKSRDARLLNELNTYHEEIPPVYFRDGEYLLGDKCWFEVRGRAFTKRKEDFLFELRQLDMLDIDINVIEHLKSIKRIGSKVITKEQLTLITDYEHFLHIRSIKRNGIKNLRNMRLRISAFRSKNNANG